MYYHLALLQLFLLFTPALSVTISYAGQLYIHYINGWLIQNFSSEGPMGGLPKMDVGHCYGFSKQQGVEGLPGDRNDNKGHFTDVYKGCCLFYQDKNCEQEIFTASNKWELEAWRGKTVGSFICYEDRCPVRPP